MNTRLGVAVLFFQTPVRAGGLLNANDIPCAKRQTDTWRKLPGTLVQRAIDKGALGRYNKIPWYR